MNLPSKDIPPDLNEQLLRQKDYLSQKKPIEPSEFEPFGDYQNDGNPEDFNLGLELISKGKTALVVLAGGQGSRLGLEGPKGCAVVLGKSLFQILAEKIQLASMAAGRSLETAIMTSPLNDQETRDFFGKNQFFGLEAKQISFFSQEMWPVLDFEGNVAGFGPNGNGCVFRILEKNGILEHWERAGIEMVSVLAIDNPLAPVFDSEIFGFHQRWGNEISIRTALKRSPNESVGAIARKNGKTVVVEYLDLKDEDRQKFDLANLGIYCFSLPFMQKAAHFQFPLHVAKKKAKEVNIWKFEEFIFDVFPLADRLKAVISERRSCFAPLKNLYGEDSIDTCAEALLAFDRQIFEKRGNCKTLGPSENR